jgi:signal transduction histidine kinase
MAVPVEKAVAMAAFGKPGRAISVASAAGLPPVRAAELDVFHLVLHLLLKALQMGGDDVPIQVELGATEKEVFVRASDSAPGIPERDLPHVFEPFFTTRRRGRTWASACHCAGSWRAATAVPARHGETGGSAGLVHALARRGGGVSGAAR